MQNRAIRVFVAAVVCTLALSAGASAKTHTQSVSISIATELCKNHGGGTECSFCDGGHCHQVSCTGATMGGKCSNKVISNIRGRPTKITAPVNGVKKGDAGSQTAARHRVQAGSDLKPIMNGGTVSHTGRRH